MSLEKVGTIPIVEEQFSVSANAVLLVLETHDLRVVSPDWHGFHSNWPKSSIGNFLYRGNGSNIDFGAVVETAHHGQYIRCLRQST